MLLCCLVLPRNYVNKREPPSINGMRLRRWHIVANSWDHFGLPHNIGSSYCSPSRAVCVHSSSSGWVVDGSVGGDGDEYLSVQNTLHQILLTPTNCNRF